MPRFPTTFAWTLAAVALTCAPARQPAPHAQAASLASAPMAPAPASRPSPPRVDFARQVQPILTARCQPCHFAGGKMYDRLPFDQAGTILRLREKLFTRIKDETERQTIRQFLAEHPAAGGSG